MAEVNYLNLKAVYRMAVSDEKIETGKVLFCVDTYETFFDQNSTIRICLGRINPVSFESELPAPSVKDIGLFNIILEEAKIKYTTSELQRIDVTTRDQMIEILGGWDTFIPFNLISEGRLIAPRTLASCVFSGDGVPIEDFMMDMQNFVDKFRAEGIDASQITSGTIDFERVPKEARMDFYAVENEEARLKLTIDQIQNGDVVQEEDTGKMFFVVDETKLGLNTAFKEFTVGSIPWNSVINRPLSLTIKNGATGTVLTNTSSTVESQKLILPVNLNVDYVEAGILSKIYGGTGNQTGTAAFVENIKSNEEMNMAGFNADNKVIQSTSITARDGIIYPVNIVIKDIKVASQLPYIATHTIELSKNGAPDSIYAVGTDKLKTNILKYDNGVIFGDRADHTKINGVDIEITAETKISNKIGINDILIITNNNVEATKPVITKDKLILKSDGSTNAGILEYMTLGTCVAYTPNNPDGNGLYPNMTTSTFSSSVKGTVLSNQNSTYCIKRTKGAGFVPSADYIIELSNDDAKVNGDLNVGHDVTIFNTLKVKGRIYGTASQAVNADTLDGKHGSDYMYKDGSNNTNPPVIIQSAIPAGRTNCLWINSTTGIANYWTGTAWTPISNTWKN